MESGNFYFIKDEYFSDFRDKFLMQNKEVLNGQLHNRPCFYAIQWPDTSEIFWFIPISSRVDKYMQIYKQKIAKQKRCDTLVFGEVLGVRKAFLLQNICPVTRKYIENQYVDNLGNAVKVSKLLESELISKTKRILALQRQGKKLVFPDILSIEKLLLAKSENYEQQQCRTRK